MNEERPDEFCFSTGLTQIVILNEGISEAQIAVNMESYDYDISEVSLDINPSDVKYKVSVSVKNFVQSPWLDIQLPCYAEAHY